MTAEGLEGTLRLKFGALYLRIQAGIAPTLLEPNFLARTNILSHVPPVVFQGLELIAVRAEPERDTLPLAIRFRQRHRHRDLHSLESVINDGFNQSCAVHPHEELFAHKLQTWRLSTLNHESIF